MVKIRGKLLKVDILEELSAFEWSREKITDEKFIACSPFRTERRPSFAVRLDNGVWIDSGAYVEELKKGNFIKLLAFLRNETYEETEEYLLSKYGTPGNVEDLELNLSLSLETKAPKIFTEEELDQYRFFHPYLSRRGIPEKVQRAFQVGYDRQNKAVTIPWTDRQGQVVNIKFRSVRSKMFWYASGGQPVKNHIFGIYFIHRLKKEKAYLVESEIDAMYLWAHGFPAIALGGANLTEQQKKLILQSPIETLILATDNDKAGRRIREAIIQQLGGFVDLWELTIPEVKDVNELKPDELKQAAENIVKVA